jgi:transposase-like protein
LDWEPLYCPNRRCEHYGKPFKIGWLVRNGSSRGESQARCQRCGSSVTLSYGTAYYGLETAPLIFETALRALAEGNSRRATARIVDVDQDLVRGWLARAARPCRAVMLSLWRALPATECQPNERWRFGHTKHDNLPGAQHQLDSDGDPWGWRACAPVWRLVLGCVVGNRDQASAHRVRGQVAGTRFAIQTPFQCPPRAWASRPCH